MVYSHVMLKRYICSTIIFAVLAIPSTIIILLLFAGPGDTINNLIVNHIIIVDLLDSLALDFSFVAAEIYILLAQLQISLLLLTYVYIIILDTIHWLIKHTSASRIFDKFSSFIIFKISNWLIKSAIFAIFIIFINNYYLNTRVFEANQFIHMSGVVLINLYLLTYYFTMFLIILIVKNWLVKNTY